MDLARCLASAQTTPVPGDVEGNVDQHLALAELAQRAGAELVLFPELSLTGYELKRARDLAFTAADRRLSGLRTWARQAEVTLVVGAPVLLGSSLHIGALVLDSSGPVHVYAKRHLGAFPASVSPRGTVPPPEDQVFEPGLEHLLVECGRGTAGVAICADIGRPAHAKAVADRGASTFLASAFLIPADYADEAGRLAEYAARHRMATVLANYGGPTGGLPSAGRSAIWSATGVLLAELGTSGAGVAVAIETATGWRGETFRLDGA